MVSKDDYKTFRNAVKSVYMKGKCKKQLVITIDPKKYFKAKKGKGIVAILAPYVISVAVGASAKLVRDIFTIFWDYIEDENNKKGFPSYTMARLKEKYGTLRDFTKNFIQSPEILAAFLTPLMYKELIKKIPNESLRDYLFDKIKGVEKKINRLDFKFENKYESENQLSDRYNTKEGLQKIAYDIGVDVTKPGKNSKRVAKTKEELAKDIIAAQKEPLLPSFKLFKKGNVEATMEQAAESTQTQEGKQNQPDVSALRQKLIAPTPKQTQRRSVMPVMEVADNDDEEDDEVIAAFTSYIAPSDGNNGEGESYYNRNELGNMTLRELRELANQEFGIRNVTRIKGGKEQLIERMMAAQKGSSSV